MSEKHGEFVPKENYDGTPWDDTDCEECVGSGLEGVDGRHVQECSACNGTGKKPEGVA